MEPNMHRGSDRDPRYARIALRATAAFVAVGLIAAQGVSCSLFVCPRAGGNVAISVEPLDQEYPSVISDGSGSAIIVWSDQQIHAQKVDAEMDLLWGDDGVVVTAADGWQQRAVVCGDGSGGIIATWEDCRNGTDNRDIYVQRILSTGSPAWTANGVALTNASGDQIAPAIAPDGAGGAIVAWITGDDDLETRDIFVQRVDANGDVKWASGGVAVCTAAGNQVVCAVVSDGAGGAIVTWQDERGVDIDIYAQRFATSGTAVWTPDGVAVCTAAGDQYGLVACPDGSGGAILVWQDASGAMAEDDIRAQRIDAGGAVKWAADGVAVCDAVHYQHEPVVIGDGAGNAFIAWVDYRGWAEERIDEDIYAQKIDRDGSPLWTVDGVAVCADLETQRNPQLALDGAGGVYAAWEVSRDGYDVCANRVNVDGAIEWGTEGVTLSTLYSSQWNPHLAAVDGGVVIAWTDFRNVDDGLGRDLFADFVSASGD